MKRLEDLTKEELVRYVQDLSKRWLAHDGLWFQAAEARHGMEEAIELDRMAWERFTAIEAKRTLEVIGREPGGGLDALEEALAFRLYAHVNVQRVERPDPKTLEFTMEACRVQAARRRKGLPDFPCKPVGTVEYEGFARAVDPRIRTECVFCPPDAHPEGAFCRWRFTLEDD